MKAYAANGIASIMPIVPFVGTDVLNRMAKDTLERNGLLGIAPIMPFIDSKLVEDYIMKGENK